MTSTAKVLSSFQSARAGSSEVARTSRQRRARWGWLQVFRDVFGGALLLAAWLALWTVTWAAVAGPLSPARDVGPGTGAATSVERP